MDHQRFEQGIAALYRTGYHLLNSGNPKRAASLFRAMLTAAPEDERGWLALGVCHEQVEQQDVAIEIYRSASFVLPSASRCELACARLLRDRGDEEESDEFFARAAEHADDDVAQLLEQEYAS